MQFDGIIKAVVCSSQSAPGSNERSSPFGPVQPRSSPPPTSQEGVRQVDERNVEALGGPAEDSQWASILRIGPKGSRQYVPWNRSFTQFDGITKAVVCNAENAIERVTFFEEPLP